MDAAAITTHSPAELAKLEADTGLLFSGYMQTGEPHNTLIPVLLRADRSSEDRKSRVLSLNK